MAGHCKMHSLMAISTVERVATVRSEQCCNLLGGVLRACATRNFNLFRCMPAVTWHFQPSKPRLLRMFLWMSLASYPKLYIDLISPGHFSISKGGGSPAVPGTPKLVHLTVLVHIYCWSPPLYLGMLLTSASLVYPRVSLALFGVAVFTLSGWWSGW